MNTITGIFTTKDELQARRVLQANIREYPAIGFVYKEGAYEIVIPGTLPEETAAKLNRWSKAIANTDLKPQHLGAFRQYDSADAACAADEAWFVYNTASRSNAVYGPFPTRKDAMLALESRRKPASWSAVNNPADFMRRLPVSEL